VMLVYPQLSQFPIRKKKRLRTVVNQMADGRTISREFAASVRNGAADQGNWPRNSRIPMATFRSTLACPAGVGMRWPQAWHS